LSETFVQEYQILWMGKFKSKSKTLSTHNYYLSEIMQLPIGKLQLFSNLSNARHR